MDGMDSDMENSARVKLSPSILSADFARLGEQVAEAAEAGADYVHVDVMDGHFVPPVTVGAQMVEALRSCTELPLDVHLMIESPERQIDRFASAGADIITVHVEATTHLHRAIQQIKGLGKKEVVSLNPATPVESLDGCLDLCDLVLVMSVMPGFGGQAFAPVALEKLRHLQSSVGGKALLSIDGGVNLDTVGLCAEAGADVVVAGPALFSQENYGRFIQEMTDRAKSAKEVRVTAANDRK